MPQTKYENLRAGWRRTRAKAGLAIAALILAVLLIGLCSGQAST